ncbi:MAG TPA: GyrI-like domain-containing protein [Candidatus Binatia bacterium]|nr:GyrI-like domain-containing protein [Candidatus Binatia bacterium]
MEKLDLKREYKPLYAPSAKKVELVDVPGLQFATIEGAIEAGHEPGTSPDFQQATEALYGIAYTLKFASKKRADNPIDYPVMALEGLWWVDDSKFDITVKDNWHWRLMILQPEHIDDEMFQEALQQLQRKRDNPALSRLSLQAFHEGLCVQTMHIGPYSAEPATVARMEAFAAENGYQMCGEHHEIYLGDPRRAAPEKLRTILRHPVQRSTL